MVEVTTGQLFEQLGRLYAEVRILTDQNSQYQEAIKLLREELAKAREDGTGPKGKTKSPTT